jgi:signal transduction histidine kinase
VLGFARIEAGKTQFEIVNVPVHDSITKLADMIAPQAAGKQLAYSFDGCGEDIAVRADRDRLDQIMLNLIGNAVKYTPNGGSINVSVDCDPKTVRIAVSDTGPGVPKEKQEVIFQPFVQLGSSAEATASGVGLGLAISRDLARAMKGDVSVASNGKGSTFILTLPRGVAETHDAARP